MMPLDPNYYQKITIKQEQIDQYFKNAKKYAEMLKEVAQPELIFTVCYESIIRLGVAALAQKGYKVRSIPGHHIKILEGLAELYNLKPEMEFVDKMRIKRNEDLYSGGTFFGGMELDTFKTITEDVFEKVKKSFM